MPKMIGRALVAVVCVLDCGGSPSVTEIRMGQAPPRPLLCSLDWLPKVPAQAPEPIGSITVWRGAPADPLGEAARAIIGPRACIMGGTTVALIGVSTIGAREPVASYTVYAMRPSH